MAQDKRAKIEAPVGTNLPSLEQMFLSLLSPADPQHCSRETLCSVPAVSIITAVGTLQLTKHGLAVVSFDLPVGAVVGYPFYR